MKTSSFRGHIIWSSNVEATKPSLDVLMRRARNALLAASDWTQMPDSPANPADWATYRQALRDIPEQDGFPETINWPEEPT